MKWSKPCFSLLIVVVSLFHAWLSTHVFCNRFRTQDIVITLSSSVPCLGLKWVIHVEQTLLRPWRWLICPGGYSNLADDAKPLPEIFGPFLGIWPKIVPVFKDFFENFQDKSQLVIHILRKIRNWTRVYGFSSSKSYPVFRDSFKKSDSLEWHIPVYQIYASTPPGLIWRQTDDLYWSCICNEFCVTPPIQFECYIDIQHYDS